jgi:hypothetical protein
MKRRGHALASSRRGKFPTAGRLTLKALKNLAQGRASRTPGKRIPNLSSYPMGNAVNDEVVHGIAHWVSPFEPNRGIQSDRRHPEKWMH